MLENDPQTLRDSAQLFGKNSAVSKLVKLNYKFAKFCVLATFSTKLGEINPLGLFHQPIGAKQKCANTRSLTQ